MTRRDGPPALRAAKSRDTSPFSGPSGLLANWPEVALSVRAPCRFPSSFRIAFLIASRSVSVKSLRTSFSAYSPARGGRAKS